MPATYAKIGEAREFYGVSEQTLRKWLDQGKVKGFISSGGTRYFDLSNDQEHQVPTTKLNIFYCRVSTTEQRNDLERQIKLAQECYPEHKIIQDIGSGVNWKRKGLVSLLGLVKRGAVKSVTVFHRDRLCRFGFELFKQFFNLLEVELLVHEQDEHKSSEQELAEDLLSIVHVYSCRNMGKRRYLCQDQGEEKDVVKSRGKDQEEDVQLEQEDTNEGVEIFEVSNQTFEETGGDTKDLDGRI